MRNQYNIRDESKNEFMQNQSNNFAKVDYQRQKAEEYQKMFMMFQKMATDPSLFMKMMSSVHTPEADHEQRKRQFQVEQHKYRNHQVSPKRRDAESPIASKQSRKRGNDTLTRSNNEQDNILEKYYQPPNERINSLAESNITVSTKQQHMALNDQRPIQSTHVLNKRTQQAPKAPQTNQQMPINRYTPEDDRPIKPAKGYNYEMESNQSAVMNNSSSAVNPSKYWQAEQRPIKGIQGDFKAHIMKEQGFPMSQNVEENQQEHQNQQVPKARAFLKRGSRQHLSSAKDKSVAKPKANQKAAKEDSDLNRSNLKEDDEKPQRSISQNRVLGRKSVSSKSIAKKPPIKQKGEEDKKTMQYSQTTTNYNSSAEGSRTPRIAQNNQIKNRQNSSSPTFQLESEKKPKKPAKKNIFQESSDSQDESKVSSITNNKTEVVPGVYLTKKQLHQILTKHGKNSAPAPSADEVQLQELKSKYIDLCNILAEQKQIFETEMKKEREEFEQYKIAEIAKIKNERKVQQRNMQNTQKSKEREKEREQFENMKKAFEKEREQFKHKEKNYKLMIQKYKKIAQERQKTASIHEQKSTNFDSTKSQEGTITNKKKMKNYPESTSQQTDDAVTSSYKGVEENNGISINKRTNQNRDNSFVKQNKDNQKLPNYQDLKKSAGPSNLNANASKISNDRNKKYEYYQELDNKETVKDKGKTNNKFFKPSEQYGEQNSERSEDEDREEIVEYNPSMKLSDLTKIPLNIKMVTKEMIDNLFRSDNNPEYKKYLELTRKPRTRIHTSRSAAEKKTTNVYADGGKQIVFDTGVRKQYFNNGYVIIFFSNGDIKQKLPDETVLYFYKEKEVDQITLPNKVNIYRFDNNQVEFHFEDNRAQVRHPDGTFKIL